MATTTTNWRCFGFMFIRAPLNSIEDEPISSFDSMSSNATAVRLSIPRAEISGA